MDKDQTYPIINGDFMYEFPPCKKRVFSGGDPSTGAGRFLVVSGWIGAGFRDYNPETESLGGHVSIDRQDVCRMKMIAMC